MTQEQHKRLKPGLTFLITLVALSLVAALIWPLVNRWERRTVAEQGGTVRIGARQAPGSLDIRTEPGQGVEQALLGNVYQTLVGLDDQGKPEPGVADHWRVSADGLTYTFHLRAGEEFEDGSALDSDAALWSLQQILANKYVGWQSLNNLAQVTNPSSDELRVELKSPDARLPRILASRAGIVYNRGARVNYASQSAGSGPYAVEDYQNGQELTLSRSKTYNGPHKAAIGTVILSYKEGSSGQAQQVADGKLDAAVDLSPQEAGTAKGLKGFATSTGVSQSNLVLAFNDSQTSILSDQRFKEAVRYGVDRPAIAAGSNGTAKALNGPVNDLSAGYDAGYAPFQHDAAKARSLAGYFNPSFYHGRLRLVYEQSLGGQVGQQVKDQLAEAGIPAEVTMLDQAAFQDQVMTKRDYELTLLTMSNDDISQFADPNSTMLFDDPECQQLFRLATGASSEQDYASRLKQYARSLADKSPSDWLTAKTPVNVRAFRLKGLNENMSDDRLAAWRIDRG
ncbi:peptide ABC transporter, solute binding protein [Bifidobacterium actinocoloniiforme DSM 22766]|uniref:Peptide ABC transporter, solute binding protein n=1 Tax=Bifidobacterium actinocoloniiforme DSM 22766 TaxID=1437605 RepID=A0A086YVV8_9BIFI|nr:ABC transporter substrate-binding protein [Bifidobacterium actinocoloniiforme]AKV54942.1 hypothetical protein AB656_00065 [Bifidobacterium actinocoloniiforme DSM 22766]KFI38408.1 peptide ABC transporter, solute binding protein [Bifidobacterium actinocoloniiforme DSM 22766]